MISAAFVGLGLTSIHHIISVFQRPLRPDVPLASCFPAWLDGGYRSVALEDESVRHSHV